MCSTTTWPGSMRAENMSSLYDNFKPKNGLPSSELLVVMYLEVNISCITVVVHRQVWKKGTFSGNPLYPLDLALI